MKPDNAIVAHNVKLIRELKSESQGEFAERLNSTQRNISTYEKGDFMPGADFLIELSKYAGVGLETLLTVKLKLDRSGRFSNLPDADKEYNKIYHEIQELITQHELNTKRFLEDINKLYGQLGKHLKGKKNR